MAEGVYGIAALRAVIDFPNARHQLRFWLVAGPLPSPPPLLLVLFLLLLLAKFFAWLEKFFSA